MCGFAGVVVWDDRYRVSPETLRKMSARIAHRGPDGEGYYIDREQQATPDRPQVALAFRRLAILDPDPRSDQPFTDGRHWLVFNGEIYNFRELRKELSSLRPGYEWRTTGDTEVLLAAYAQWGEKCVEHLNGMFAFAVWDEREKTLFLARDRMGQKPLYMAAPVWPKFPVLAFASEISALRELTWFKSEIDEHALREYLRYGYGCRTETIFHSCLRFGPSMWNTFHRGMSRDGGLYFNPNVPSTSGPSQSADGRGLLKNATQRQLVSDVPLGCFLSGGVDSSIIAAAMQRTTSKRQTLTFSIGFDDSRYDERPLAAAVAKHLGTEHHEFVVRPDASTDLPKLAAVFGEPFGDSSALPTHYLARETRQFVKVALSGDGGDELFGGYDRYRAMRIAERMRSFPPLARRAVSAGISTLRGTHPKSLASRLRRFAKSVHQPAPQSYSQIMRIFDDSTIQELTGAVRQDRDLLAAQFINQTKEGRDVVQAALATDRSTYLPGDLLTKADRCSMLHGLEVRSPFMDHELVQFAAGLTTDQLLKGGPKRMLREAFKDDLPAWVFKRKKMGFAVPIGEWFRGELRPMLRDTLFAGDSFGRQHFNMKVVERLVDEHERNRVDHSQRLYALLMLELWWNTVKT